MPLGASALPPVGYVAFCERQPWDCGAEPQLVLAQAKAAEADRAALYAAASPAALRALSVSAPAAVFAPAAVAVAPTAARAEAPAEAEAAPAVTPAVFERAPVLTQVDFVAPPAAPTELAPRPEETAPPPVEETGPARMGPQLWARLNRVNDEVNRTIIQSTDLATYGKVDYWATPLENGIRYGDCEDYVLEKQRALIAAGVPREDLNIAVVTTPWGEAHAVLLVATTDGELVLDNLSPWVKPWAKAGYRWREREVGGDPFHWAMVQDPTRPHTAPGGEKLVVASLR